MRRAPGPGQRVRPPPRPLLRTGRLVLVPQTLAAARDVVAGGTAGLDFAPGYPHDDSLDVLRFMAGHGVDDADGGWFVTLAADGRVIGDCGLKGWADADGRVEVGYGLAAPFRGLGYGSEAVGALLGWLRTRSEVRTVLAEVLAANAPSRRLVERLGFAATAEEGGSVWYALALRPAVGGPQRW